MNGISSALKAFVVLFLFSAGLFCTLLPYLPEARIRMAHFLLEKAELFYPIGALLFLGALIMLLAFYASDRGRFLVLKMGRHAAMIDRVLLQKTFEECLRTHFPGRLELEDIELVKGKRLEVGLAGETEESLLAAAEQHLQTVLRERFGYTSPFFVILRSKRKGS